MAEGAGEGGCGAAVRSARHGGKVPDVEVVKISDGKACRGRAEEAWQRDEEPR